MVPAAFVGLAALPLTASGKVDRRALAGPAFAPQGAAAAAGYVAPATGTEQELAAIWSEVLGVGRVGARDDFFDLGGHSLLAVQILSRMRDRLGVDLPVRVLFEAPTLAALARRVDAARPRPDAPGLAPCSASRRCRRGAGRPGPRSPSPRPGSGSSTVWSPGARPTTSPSPCAWRGELVAGRAGGGARRGGAPPRGAAHDLRGARRRAGAGDRAGGRRWDLPLADLGALPAAAGLGGGAAARRRRRRRGRSTSRAGRSSAPPCCGSAAAEHVLLLEHPPHRRRRLVGGRAGPRDHGALRRGRRRPAPRRCRSWPIQYADFAVWQRGWLQGAELERQLAYWRQALAGAPATLDLPADRPRPAVRSEAGARVRVAFAAALREELAPLRPPARGDPVHGPPRRLPGPALAG